MFRKVLDEQNSSEALLKRRDLSRSATRDVRYCTVVTASARHEFGKYTMITTAQFCALTQQMRGSLVLGHCCSNASLHHSRLVTVLVRAYGKGAAPPPVTPFVGLCPVPRLAPEEVTMADEQPYVFGTVRPAVRATALHCGTLALRGERISLLLRPQSDCMEA